MRKYSEIRNNPLQINPKTFFSILLIIYTAVIIVSNFLIACAYVFGIGGYEELILFVFLTLCAAVIFAALTYVKTHKILLPIIVFIPVNILIYLVSLWLSLIPLENIGGLDAFGAAIGSTVYFTVTLAVSTVGFLVAIAVAKITDVCRNAHKH